MRKTMMMAALAAVATAGPAIAEGNRHSGHKATTKSVSATTMETDKASPNMAPATGGMPIYNSTPNTERTPDGMNNRSSESKASGVRGNPNSTDPASAPR